MRVPKGLRENPSELQRLGIRLAASTVARAGCEFSRYGRWWMCHAKCRRGISMRTGTNILFGFIELEKEAQSSLRRN